MLTKPAISDENIIACLRDSFGLPISQVTFLPIGADLNSAVYRLTANDGTSYFLKLRRGDFDEMAVAVPAFLHAQGIRRVTAPIGAKTHELSVHAHEFDWIVFPFFEGKNGFEVALSPAQWIALGESLRAVHTTRLPAELVERVPREDFSPRWHQIVRVFHDQVDHRASDDPIAARLGVFWTTKRDEIQRIVERAEHLAQALRRRALDL
ncbi:MAG TPA: aminoglycoside phosphotransferase family protein, partial [Chloroflexota bacterium]|nr:aminoglycoside phosphotransferase family protein [Chloroflexota bacterium]